MPAIKVRENEPFDIALRRFRRLCDRAGVITDVRKKEFFEKPTWVNKRKKAAAVKRNTQRNGKKPYSSQTYVLRVPLLAQHKNAICLS